MVIYASLLMHKITRFSGGSNNYLISISDACRQYIKMSTMTVMRYENSHDLYWWQSHRYCGYYCGFLPTFVMQANAENLLEVTENGDFSIQVHRPPKSIYKPQVRNPAEYLTDVCPYFSKFNGTQQVTVETLPWARHVPATWYRTLNQTDLVLLWIFRWLWTLWSFRNRVLLSSTPIPGLYILTLQSDHKLLESRSDPELFLLLGLRSHGHWSNRRFKGQRFPKCGLCSSGGMQNDFQWSMGNKFFHSINNDFILIYIKRRIKQAFSTHDMGGHCLGCFLSFKIMVKNTSSSLFLIFKI